MAWKAKGHATEAIEFCNAERTFENYDIVLPSQLESFTFSFDRGGSPRGVTTILGGIQIRFPRISGQTYWNGVQDLWFRFIGGPVFKDITERR